MTYAKTPEGKLEETNEVKSVYSVEDIKIMITVCDNRIATEVARKAEWEKRLAEATKVGIDIK